MEEMKVPDWLVKGAEVSVIYNAGRTRETIVDAVVSNVGKAYVTLKGWDIRFRLDSLRRFHDSGTGFDILVNRDGDEAKKARARNRRRVLEEHAKFACNAFVRTACKQTREAAMSALAEYDEAMCEIDK